MTVGEAAGSAFRAAERKAEETTDLLVRKQEAVTAHASSA